MVSYPSNRPRASDVKGRAGLSDVAPLVPAFLAPAAFPVEVEVAEVAVSAIEIAEITSALALVGPGLLLGAAAAAIYWYNLPAARNNIGVYAGPYTYVLQQSCGPGGGVVIYWNQGDPGIGCGHTSWPPDAIYSSPDDVFAASGGPTGWVQSWSCYVNGTADTLDRYVRRIMDPLVEDTTVHPWTVVPAGTPFPTIAPAPALPMEDPAAFPILQPMEFPLPQKFADAGAEPGTQPDAPEEAPLRRLVELPILTGVPLVNVVFPPNLGIAIPVTSIDVTDEISPSADAGSLPGGSTSNIHFDPPVAKGGSRLATPGKKVKERKISVHTVAGKGWAFLNALTEGIEFVDDLWKSLPKEDRRHPRFASRGNNPGAKPFRPSPFQKMQDLYKHWQDMNVAQAVTNVINDQAQDLFYAQLSKPAQKLLRATGAPTGSGFLRRQQGQITHDTGTSFRPPSLTYDQAAGTWGFDWGGPGLTPKH